MEVYSPAHAFGLHGRRWVLFFFFKCGCTLKGMERRGGRRRERSGAGGKNKKEKKKVWKLLYLDFLFILAGTMGVEEREGERGNSAFQVTRVRVKKRWKRRRGFIGGEELGARGVLDCLNVSWWPGAFCCVTDK